MQSALYCGPINCRESAVITLVSAGVTLSEDYVHNRVGQWITDAEDAVIVRVANPKAFAISLWRESENTPSKHNMILGGQDREGSFMFPDGVYWNRVIGQREFINIKVSDTLYPTFPISTLQGLP